MVNPHRRLCVGLLFEGFAGWRKSTGYQVRSLKQLVVGYGPDMPNDDDSAWAWLPGLVGPPSLGESSVDPLRGDWSVAGLNAELSYTDRLAAIFFREDRSGKFRLVEDISSSATTLTLTGSPSPSPAYLYVGDETILVGNTDDNPTYSVTRGSQGSQAQSHKAGDYVGVHPQYWVPRGVSLVYHDLDTQEEWTEWVGYLDDVRTNEQGSKIVLAGNEFFKRWASAEANRDAPDLSKDGTIKIVGEKVTGGVRMLPRSRSSVGPVYLHMLGGIIEADYLGSSLLKVEAQEGDGILGSAITFDASTLSVTQRNPAPVGPVTRGTVVDTSKPLASPCYEVVVWDRSEDIAPIVGPDKFHPVRIALYLLQSTSPYSINVGVDTPSFGAAINSSIGLQIDRLVLGLAGEPYKPFDLASDLLRAYGFSPTITRDGRYGVKRFKTLSISQIQAAQSSTISPYGDGPLQRLQSFAAGSSAIKAEVGGGFEWEKSSKINVISTGASRRAVLISPREEISYSLPFLSPAETERVALQLATSASMAHYGFPRLRFRVADWRVTGASYDLLQDVVIADLGTLAQAWWVDSQGGRVGDLTGRIDAIGTIVARTLDTSNRSYELTLLLVAFDAVNGSFARERAPSGVISAIDDTDPEVVILTLANQIHDAEASYFTEGDNLARWSRGGVKVADQGEVLAVSGDDLIVRKPVTFNVGEVLRLSNSTIYANVNRYTITDRPYVFFADTDSEIERAASTESADVYGGGLGVV